MKKSKIVKIVTAITIGIFAIVYYFFNKDESNSYENMLADEVVVQNEITKEETEEKTEKIKIYVTGEVNNPGVIELEEGARIQDAIEGCGGITAQANLKNINLAYEVEDGEKIYIPNLSEPEDEVESSETLSSSSNSNSSGKININKATEAELTTIPGVGASTAQKIVVYREENGKFKTIEDIKNVSGIGASKYENIKDYITVK